MCNKKNSKDFNGMKFKIVGWPEIQELMDVKGFEENATLITPNDSMGIGSSTYLVNKEWLEE